MNDRGFAKGWPGLLWLPALVVLLSGCVIRLGGESSSEARYKVTKVTEVDYVVGSSLDVETECGGVTVTRAQREDVRIEARFSCKTQERADRVRVAASRQDSGTLHVGVDWPDDRRKRGEGCTFLIEVPGTHGIRVETSYGSIRVDGLSGEADLHTSYGTVSATGQDGPVRARTSYGRIVVSGASGSLDLETTYGGVEASLTDGNTGPVLVETSYGNVNFHPGTAFVGRLDMKTSYGSIDLEGSDQWRRPVTLLTMRKSSAAVAFGSESGHSKIRTSYGSIRVSPRE